LYPNDVLSYLSNSTWTLSLLLLYFWLRPPLSQILWPKSYNMLKIGRLCVVTGEVITALLPSLQTWAENQRITPGTVSSPRKIKTGHAKLPLPTWPRLSGLHTCLFWSWKITVTHGHTPTWDSLSFPLGLCNCLWDCRSQPYVTSVFWGGSKGITSSILELKKYVCMCLCIFICTLQK
jgi:hypothetical protein